MTYNDLPWLPLCGGLTLIGLIASWLIWRRRGAAAGLRMVAWSLLPLAAYLTRAVRMLWEIGSAIGSFASALVFSPQVWSGVIVAAVAAVLFVVSGTMRRSRARKVGPGQDSERRAPVSQPGPAGKELKPAKGKGKPAFDEEFGDVADILRRRGIS